MSGLALEFCLFHLSAVALAPRPLLTLDENGHGTCGFCRPDLRDRERGLAR